MPRTNKTDGTHRTKADMVRFRAALHRHLLSGGQPKGFARERGVSLTDGWIYRVSHLMDWQSFYVSKEEKAHLLARRKSLPSANLEHAA